MEGILAMADGEDLGSLKEVTAERTGSKVNPKATAASDPDHSKGPEGPTRS